MVFITETKCVYCAVRTESDSRVVVHRNRKSTPNVAVCGPLIPCRYTNIISNRNLNSFCALIIREQQHKTSIAQKTRLFRCGREQFSPVPTIDSVMSKGLRCECADCSGNSVTINILSMCWLPDQ